MFRGLHPPSLNHKRLNQRKLPRSQLRLNLWKKLPQRRLRLRSLQKSLHKLSLPRKLHLPKSLWRHLPQLLQSSHQTKN